MIMELDDVDKKLLHHIQNNARMTNAEFAEQVGLSPSGVQKRLRKLEETGIIQSYVALLDRSKLGYDMLCFVQVTLRVQAPDAVAELDKAVKALSEVLECHRMTGGADYLLKVVVRNRDHLDHFLMNVLMPLPMIDRVRTNIVLKEVKETTTVATDCSEFGDA